MCTSTVFSLGSRFGYVLCEARAGPWCARDRYSATHSPYNAAGGGNGCHLCVGPLSRCSREHLVSACDFSLLPGIRSLKTGGGPDDLSDKRLVDVGHCSTILCPRLLGLVEVAGLATVCVWLRCFPPGRRRVELGPPAIAPLHPQLSCGGLCNRTIGIRGSPCPSPGALRQHASGTRRHVTILFSLKIGCVRGRSNLLSSGKAFDCSGMLEACWLPMVATSTIESSPKRVPEPPLRIASGRPPATRQQREQEPTNSQASHACTTR